MSEMRCLFVAVLALVLRARMPDRRSTGGSLRCRRGRHNCDLWAGQTLVRVTVEVNYYENRKWLMGLTIFLSDESHPP